MTSTIGEAIQRVISLYGKGVPSKDSRLTHRHAYSCLIGARSTILEQKANKKYYLSQWNVQTLPCIELIDAPLHECPCAPQGILMLRSKEKLPKPVTRNDSPLIYTVSTLDNSVVFDRKEWNTYNYVKGKKYTSLKPFYMERNEYLYIGNATRIKAVVQMGVYADPLNVYNFPSSCDDCDDCKCGSPLDLEFPLDGELLTPVIQLAANELIYLFKQMAEDRRNDASDDNSIRGTMVHTPQGQQ